MSSFYNRDAFADLMAQYADVVTDSIALNNTTGPGSGGAIENVGGLRDQGYGGKAFVGAQGVSPYGGDTVITSPNPQGDLFQNLADMGLFGNTASSPSLVGPGFSVGNIGSDINQGSTLGTTEGFSLGDSGLFDTLVSGTGQVLNNSLLNNYGFQVGDTSALNAANTSFSGGNTNPFVSLPRPGDLGYYPSIETDSHWARLGYTVNPYTNNQISDATIANVNRFSSTTTGDTATTGGTGATTTDAGGGISTLTTTGQTGANTTNVGGLGSFDNLGGTITTTGTAGTDDDLVTNLLTPDATEIVTTGTAGTDDDLVTNLLTPDATEIVTTGTAGTDDELKTNLLTPDGTTEIVTTGTAGTDDELKTNLLTPDGTTEIVTTGTAGTDDDLVTNLLAGDTTEIVTTGTAGTDDDLVTNLLAGDTTEIVTTGTAGTDDDLVTNLLAGDTTEIVTTGTTGDDDDLVTNLLAGDTTEIVTTGTTGDDEKLNTGALVKLISAATGFDIGDVIEIITKAKDPKKLVVDTLGSLGLGNIDIGEIGGDFTFDDSSFAPYIDPRVGDFSGTNDNTTAGTGGDGFAIPQRTAIRSVVPGTYDPNRRAGSGGQRYFSDMQYVPNVADPAAQRAANLAAQAQTNTQAMMLAYQNAFNPAYQTRPGATQDRATYMLQRALGITGMLPTAQVGAGLTPTAQTTTTAADTGLTTAEQQATQDLVDELVGTGTQTTTAGTGTTTTDTGGTGAGAGTDIVDALTGTTTTDTGGAGTDIVDALTGTTTTDTGGASITTPAADTDTEYNNFVQQFSGRQLNAEDAAALAASGYSLNRLAETFKADPENLRSFISQQTGGTATLDDGTTGRAGMANLLEELGGTKNSDGTVTDNFGTTLSWQDGAFRPISEFDGFVRNLRGKTLTLEDLASIGASGYDTTELAAALEVDPDKLSGAITGANTLTSLANDFTGTIDATYAQALIDSGYGATTLAPLLGMTEAELTTAVADAQTPTTTAAADTTTTAAAAGTDIVDALTGTTTTDTGGADTTDTEYNNFVSNLRGKTLTLEDLTSIGASGYDTTELAAALEVDPDKLSGAITEANTLTSLANDFTGTIDATYAQALVDSGFSADTLAGVLNVPGFTGDLLADVVNAQLNNQATTTTAAADTTTTAAAAGTTDTTTAGENFPEIIGGGVVSNTVGDGFGEIVGGTTGTTTTDTGGADTDIVDTLLNSTEQYMVANSGYIDNGDGTITDSTNGYVYDADTGKGFFPTTDTAGAGTDIVDTLTGTTDTTTDTTASSLELFAQNNAGKTLTSEDLVALNNLAGEGYSAQDVIDTLGLKDADGNPISETQLNSTLNRAVGTNTLNTIAADTDGLDENQVRDIAGLITSNTLGIGDVANTFGVSGMDVVAELFNAGYETGADLTDRLGAFNEGLTEVDLVSNLLNSGKTDVNTVAEKYNTTPEAIQAELDKVNEQKTLDYLAGLSDEEVGGLINENKLSIGQAVRVYQDRYPGLSEADVQAALTAQGFAQGGDVQGYYLGGTTDGMADQIPATINNMQPAALSDGEFVIPADVVSHLGNGNSDSGAKELYSMMDRIRQDRTGTTKQGRQIDPNKYLA